MLLNLKRIFRFFKFYKGPYFSWKSSKLDSIGYDNSKTLHFIYKTAKVAKKSGLLEKDGFVKKKFKTNPDLKKLIKQINTKKIEILDFGGGYGTLYFQYKKFINRYNWHIVEQKKVCDFAKTFLSKEKKLFYYSKLSHLPKKKFDIILLSSSLQYIEKYKHVLNLLKQFKSTYIIFLKTPISPFPFDIVFKQKIPQEAYIGSYPSWIFSKKTINELLLPNYFLFKKKLVEPKLFFSNHADLFFKKND